MMRNARDLRVLLPTVGLALACLALPVGCDNPQRDAGTVVVEPRATEAPGEAAPASPAASGADAPSADDR